MNCHSCYIFLVFFLLIFVHICVCAKSLQSCPTLCDPMYCSPSGSCVHGILQARRLEWVACPFPADLPDQCIRPGSLTSPALGGRFFTTIVTWEATQNNCSFCIYNTETTALMRWVILKGLSWSQLYGNVKITKWWKCQSTSLLKMGEKQQQQQQLLWHKVCSQMFELKRSQQSRSCWIKCAFNWCFGWMSLCSKVIHCH